MQYSIFSPQFCSFQKTTQLWLFITFPTQRVADTGGNLGEVLSVAYEAINITHFFLRIRRGCSATL